MKKETFDEIVGRALRGEPHVPMGGGDDAPAQPAAHVQKPAEIEHVADNVSKIGAESNMTAQPAAPQGVAYAELPDPVWRTLAGVAFSEKQMRDFADRTHALRAQQPAPATQQVGEVRPVTPYTCPNCYALWLHWPAEQTDFGRDTLNCRSADHCHYCEKAGVEQLQRLERIPAALHAPQPSPTAQAAPAAGAVVGPVDDIDAIALARYKVVPAHESMFHRFAVVAGDGKQQLYLGRETECQNMARKFAGAFLDGAFHQSQIAAAPTPAAQADSVLEDAARPTVILVPGGAELHFEPYTIGSPQTLWRLRRDGVHIRWLNEYEQGFINAAIDAARKQGGTQ